VPEEFSAGSRVAEALGPDADKVAFLPISEQILRGLPISKHISLATYYRLLIGDIAPRDIKRAIYLDCDLIVRADLTELWTTPLDGCVIGAVPDEGFQHRDKLGLAEDAPYFNAGVLLVNLEQWRGESVGAGALDFAGNHPERLTWSDQCALNWILRDRWLPLDATWNMQSRQFGEDVGQDFEYFRPVPAHALAARIVHFNWPARPWLYMSGHPFREEYLAYLRRTPWRNQPPPDRYPHNVIRQHLRRYAPPLLPLYMALRRYI
jgi:lipopolysaccharide biosynthesis glycosyltransferase